MFYFRLYIKIKHKSKTRRSDSPRSAKQTTVHFYLVAFLLFHPYGHSRKHNNRTQNPCCPPSFLFFYSMENSDSIFFNFPNHSVASLLLARAALLGSGKTYSGYTREKRAQIEYFAAAAASAGCKTNSCIYNMSTWLGSCSPRSTFVQETVSVLTWTPNPSTMVTCPAYCAPHTLSLFHKSPIPCK